MTIHSSVLRAASVAAVMFASSSCTVPTGMPGEGVGTTSQALDTITAVSSFGSNPGNLQMFTYVPAGITGSAPLVLALHGCTQTAANYTNAGWNTLADTYKFYVVYPQTSTANNPEGCFNWGGGSQPTNSGDLTDITRDEGEALSVKQMVDYMKTTYSIDSNRVFATGFSAGAAYAVALLALYPDVFAAGASFSGIPFKCGTTESAAEICTFVGTTMTPSQWQTLVQSGDPGYTGPYPRISLWQGSADEVVNTGNLGQLVDQWTEAHGLSQTPTTMNTIAGFPHSEYANASGVVQVESYSITGMGHAVAIDTANGCGTADTYDVNESICAVDYVAKFFGIESPAQASGADAGAAVNQDAAAGPPPAVTDASSGGTGPSSSPSMTAPDSGAGDSSAFTGGQPAGAPSAGNIAGCNLAKHGPDPLGSLSAFAFVGVCALARRRALRAASRKNARG